MLDVFEQVLLPYNGWVYFDEYAQAYHIVSIVPVRFNVDIPHFDEIPHAVVVFNGVELHFCD
eukprot:6597017-Ditylum_brightwellii.AAC.1